MMPKEILTVILLVLLIVCAIAVNVIRDLLQSVIIFMAYSSIMAVIWILMESPELGITEAAVGAGVSGILFLMTLKKIGAEDTGDPADSRDRNPNPESRTHDAAVSASGRRQSDQPGMTQEGASASLKTEVSGKEERR